MHILLIPLIYKEHAHNCKADENQGRCGTENDIDTSLEIVAPECVLLVGAAEKK